MDPDNYYFQFTIDPTSDEPIMLLDRQIGGGYDEDDMSYGIDGDSFARELLVLDTMDKKRIQIWINSPGGRVDDGMAIANAILRTKTKVDTYCTFLAASIAGVIFQTGRERVIADYGILMYHNPYDEDDENRNDPYLLTIKQSIITLISVKSGMKEKDVEEMMNRTSFIMAEEALQLGLCTKIEQSMDLNKKRPTQGSDMKAYWKGSRTIMNSLTENLKPTNMGFPKIANKLELIPEASEEAICNQIDRLLNKVSKAEKDCKDKQDELDKHEKDMKEMKDKHDKLKDELDALKKKVKDDDEADKVKNEAKLETEAKNMITGFVNSGRIKNEAPVIEKWVKAAKLDMAGTKEMIESLPLNVSAGKKIVDKKNSVAAAVGKAGKEGEVVTEDDKPVGSIIARTMINKLAKIGNG
jgi:ATP-dependent Clp protease protease subunit